MNDIDVEMCFKLVELARRNREENAAITKRLEEQRARIAVALGYIQSGQAGIAALILAGDDKEVAS